MATAVGSLLIDTLPVRLTLTEDDDTGKVIARGTFGRAGVPTNNGRVYPRELMEREIKRLAKPIERRKVLGLVDHPADGKTRLADASHVITGLKLESDGRVVGEIEVLDTDSGRNLKQILKANVEVGVSSRGIGSTRPDGKGNEIVQEDYQLVTWDFVADPAVKEAVPEVFIEETEMTTERWDADKLRDKFPNLVSQIEEQAEMRGAQKAEQTWQQVLEERTQEAVEEIKPDIYEKVREEAKDDLRDDFAMRLTQKLDDLRTEIEEQVRSEIESDPRFAKERVAMERVVDAISPFIVPEDQEDFVRERDSKIEELERQIQIKNDQIDKIKDEMADVKEAAKEMGYSYYVEKRLAGHEKADVIREMVGNVLQYESLDALGAKIVDCMEALKAEQEKIEKARSVQQAQVKRMEQQTESYRQKIASKLSALEEQVEALRDERDELKDRLVETANIAKGVGLKAYAEKQMAGHPEAPRIRRLLESTDLQTREDVDSLIDSFASTKQDDANVQERIRRHMGVGRETLTEAERERNSYDEREIVPGLGVTFGEVRQICGIGEDDI